MHMLMTHIHTKFSTIAAQPKRVCNTLSPKLFQLSGPDHFNIFYQVKLWSYSGIDARLKHKDKKMGFDLI